MKAVVKHSAAADAISFGEVPVPEIAPDQILVQVHAIGVGIHDGYYFPPAITYPYVIGIEGAGVIKKTGETVTDYHVGQRIAFISNMQPKGGTWAEYAVIDADSVIIPIPESVDFAQAAALPVAGNTILKAFYALNLEGKKSIFIAGSSGAIGTLAIQIAVQHGLRVAASASQKNHDYMANLGAELTVDYRDPQWKQKIVDWMPDGVNAAIAIQPKTSVDSLAVVKDGGEIISLSGDQFATERSISIKQLPYQTDVSDRLRDLMQNLGDDKIRMPIEHIYAFSEALDALEKVSTRHARGKVVIAVS